MRSVIVVGNGMVAHRFVQELCTRSSGQREGFSVTVIGEEDRPAYNRVALSSLFDGRTAADLHLDPVVAHGRCTVDALLGTRAVGLDRELREVHLHDGRTLGYDHLVLATGSAPFVPDIAGIDHPACHVYRTIDDLAAIAATAAQPHVRAGAVIGGGLLGLEAANALRLLGLETHVVEFADRLMPVQLDRGASAALRRRVEALGLGVHTSRATQGVLTADGTAGSPSGDSAVLRGLEFSDGATLDVDMVVVSAGIRPRDELGRAAGLVTGERGGIVVDDLLVTSDPSITAIGECASHRGRCAGLVSPGYRMASVAAARVVAGAVGAPCEDRYARADLSTKLKLLGVELACVGTLAPEDDDAVHRLVWDEPTAGAYRRLDVDAGTGRVLAAVLVGDISGYGDLLARHRSAHDGRHGAEVGEPVDHGRLVAPGRLLGPATSPGGCGTPGPPQLVCSCENVERSALEAAVASGCSTVGELKARTAAGTGCGGCLPDLEALLREHHAAPVGICEHVALTRAELFDLVRLKELRSLREILAAAGPRENAPGHAGTVGCEICRPVIGSILATITNDHILDGEQAALQDTNDHFLANLQRDGTYSVIPRIPGGEITPERLIVIGEVARDFGLHTKITGGQRIDLLGARVDQLPDIWQRLVDAGMESGHAYGKAVRTVKSCVGRLWCRYGVQDSTAMAVRLELRYRGLRSPHKLKFAVSGCARECAEAAGKDVGVIATERGWNLYVGGNGGKTPRHAVLLAEDLDDDTLVAYIDRFVMYYVRTADRLERTAAWLARLDGGIDQVRRVVVHDVLGLATELEADMERHVAGYECEWEATLADPRRRARFVEFVNAPPGSELPAADPDRGWVDVCAVGDLVEGRGVRALVDRRAVAVFRIGDELLAIDDLDPSCGVAVLSQGLVGSTVIDGDSVRYVASPMRKHRFDLRTGRCLDDPSMSVAVHHVESSGGRIRVRELAHLRETAA